jgi:hypothetical protein
MLEDFSDHELILLKSALLAYEDCPNCSHEYPRTHSNVVYHIFPKIKRAASKRFDELTSLEEQITFIEREKGVV